MNRSAQPLPEGARTKAGELSIPRKATSFRKFRHVLRSVIVTDGETLGDGFGLYTPALAVRTFTPAGAPVRGAGFMVFRRLSVTPSGSPLTR